MLRRLWISPLSQHLGRVVTSTGNHSNASQATSTSTIGKPIVYQSVSTTTTSKTFKPTMSFEARNNHIVDRIMSSSEPYPQKIWRLNGLASAQLSDAMRQVKKQEEDKTDDILLLTPIAIIGGLCVYAWMMT